MRIFTFHFFRLPEPTALPKVSRLSQAPISPLTEPPSAREKTYYKVKDLLRQGLPLEELQTQLLRLIPKDHRMYHQAKWIIELFCQGIFKEADRIIPMIYEEMASNIARQGQLSMQIRKTEENIQQLKNLDCALEIGKYPSPISFRLRMQIFLHSIGLQNLCPLFMSSKTEALIEQRKQLAKQNQQQIADLQGKLASLQRKFDELTFCQRAIPGWLLRNTLPIAEETLAHLISTLVASHNG